MYRPAYTGEVDTEFDLVVLNLVDAMKILWDSNQPYPGDPYDHDQFRQRFSDHHPVVFKLKLGGQDDD